MGGPRKLSGSVNQRAQVNGCAKASQSRNGVPLGTIHGVRPGESQEELSKAWASPGYSQSGTHK